MPPPIGHRPGRTQPILAPRGAARCARHQGEENQLGFPRGGLTHRHRHRKNYSPFSPAGLPNVTTRPANTTQLGGS